jgi:hypothetical protein
MLTQLGVPDGVPDISMTQKILNEPGIQSFVRQHVAGAVPQHVEIGRKAHAGHLRSLGNDLRGARATGMHFVPVKSVTQQAQGMVLKVRESLVGQRTLLVNTLRGHAAEFGVSAGKGSAKLACCWRPLNKKPPSRPRPKTWPSYWASDRGSRHQDQRN